MTKAPWKIGSRVRLPSGSRALSVIGYDSVGSVICRPFGDDEGRIDIYIPPSLLIDAEVAS
jgi:hypothetical protein